MELLSAILDTVLPQRCLLCGLPGSDHSVCAPCRRDLPWLEHACQRCSLPLPSDNTGKVFSEEWYSREWYGAELCGQCLMRPPSFDRCIAAFRYASPVDRLIGQFKNQRHLTAGKVLSALFAGELLGGDLRYSLLDSDPPSQPDVITPVPLHWRRQLRRGFNQAAFVAETLSKALKIPLVPVARRRNATPKQQQLNRKQRLQNLDAAFSVDPAPIRGRYVVLVDDVVTTGATAEALAALLKQAGARRVEVWALARTPDPRA